MGFDLATPWLIFTDLDGTLLDWKTYSAAIARPALARLRELGVPVIFCSSKTASEQRALRQSLQIRSIPSIVENGAAIIVPDAAGLHTGDWPPAPGEPGRKVKVLGMARAEVSQRLDRVRARTGLALRGYDHITDEQLADLSGLTLEAAGRARSREYSETLIDALNDAEWKRLDAEFAAEGLECRHGGRFHTVTGSGTDKGRAVRAITEMYEAAYGREVRTLAVGDSANDRPLLEAVDRPFLVAREDGTWASLGVPHLEKVSGRGPYGWIEITNRLLREAHCTELAPA
jgi:mannosyl-3-phosphoglycerate phosphatase family protein